MYQNEATVQLVIRDLEAAQSLGMLDDINTIKEYSDLINVIMFGGNGNEAKEIIELGYRIYDEVSKKETSSSFYFLRKEVEKIQKKSKPDTRESIPEKVKDNTDIGG